MAGQFEGEVVVRWLSHDGGDRRMKLLEPFVFIDNAGLRWEAPEEAVVDGASIPRMFWTLFGPPFVGDYRRASVVHDHWCVTKERTWRATHRMFEEACRAGGVKAVDAASMYAAVYTFGPRWDFATKSFEIPGVGAAEAGDRVRMQPSMNEEEFNEMLEWIRSDGPSLDEIDAASDARSEVFVSPVG